MSELFFESFAETGKAPPAAENAFSSMAFWNSRAEATVCGVNETRRAAFAFLPSLEKSLIPLVVSLPGIDEEFTTFPPGHIQKE